MRKWSFIRKLCFHKLCASPEQLLSIYPKICVLEITNRHQKYQKTSTDWKSAGAIMVYGYLKLAYFEKIAYLRHVLHKGPTYFQAFFFTITSRRVLYFTPIKNFAGYLASWCPFSMGQKVSIHKKIDFWSQIIPWANNYPEFIQVININFSPYI